MVSYQCNFRAVDICGLTGSGERTGWVRNVLALVDTYAGTTVVSAYVASRLGDAFLMDIPIEGRGTPSHRVLRRRASTRDGADQTDGHPAACSRLPRDSVRRRRQRSTRAPSRTLARMVKQVQILLGRGYAEAERAMILYTERRKPATRRASPRAPKRRLRQKGARQ